MAALLSERRYVFVIDTLGNGGAERVMSQLINDLAALDKDVSMVLLTSKSVEDLYSIDSRVKVLRLDVVHSWLESRNIRTKLDWYASILASAWYLRSFLKDLGVPSNRVVLTSFLLQSNVTALISSIGLGIRVIVSERGNPLMAISPFGKFVRFILYQFASAVVVQTNFALGALPGGVWRKCSIIPNAVAKFPISMGIAKQNTIAMVARLAREKRHDLVIESFSKVAKEFPDWTLEFYGAGPLQSKIVEDIAARGLQNQILLKGLTTEPWQVYDRASVFVLASDHEGFPNALLEAMSRGCACVSTNCNSGPAEMIDDGVSGFLVPVGDAASLAEKLRLLMHDENLRISFGNAAQKSVSRFKTEEIFDKWLKVWHGA